MCETIAHDTRGCLGSGFPNASLGSCHKPIDFLGAHAERGHDCYNITERSQDCPVFSRGMTGTHAPLLPPVIALAAAFVGHQFDAGNQAPLPHVTNVLEISQRS